MRKICGGGNGMKEFRMIGSSGYQKGRELGTIKANNTTECGLFIALNFPEYYFGANIIEVVGEGIQGDFSCIAVQEYYIKEDGTYTTPVEAALSSFNADMKIKNELCDVSYDYREEGEVYSPFDTLNIPCR